MRKKKEQKGKKERESNKNNDEQSLVHEFRSEENGKRG